MENNSTAEKDRKNEGMGDVSQMWQHLQGKKLPKSFLEEKNWERGKHHLMSAVEFPRESIAGMLIRSASQRGHT